MIAQPDSIANRSPDSLHIRGGDSAHQQIVHIANNAKIFMLAFVLAVCLISLLLNALFAYIYFVEKYADQNRYDWFQRDRMMPLESRVDALDKEMQAVLITQRENDYARRR